MNSVMGADDEVDTVLAALSVHVGALIFVAPYICMDSVAAITSPPSSGVSTNARVSQRNTANRTGVFHFDSAIRDLNFSFVS